MSVKPKKKVIPKNPASPRMSFYPYAEDLAILEKNRVKLQAAAIHMHVSLSDAIRYVIREFDRRETIEKNSQKIS